MSLHTFIAAALALTAVAAQAAPQEIVKLPRVTIVGKAATTVVQLPRVVVTGYAVREVAHLPRVVVVGYSQATLAQMTLAAATTPNTAAKRG